MFLLEDCHSICQCLGTAQTKKRKSILICWPSYNTGTVLFLRDTTVPLQTMKSVFICPIKQGLHKSYCQYEIFVSVEEQER